MNHLAAASFGLAAVAALLVAGRPAPPPPAVFVEHQELVLAEGKSDRLPLAAAAPAPELPNLPDTAEGLKQDAAISGATRGGKEAAPATVVRAVGAASTDRVCGVKGRTWYTRENGWRYWRCNR